ncbi:MAG: adenylate/guanylate cyclase domain-containing protein, partial [Chitinophagales bacterium]
LKDLKIDEELGNKAGIAADLNFIGDLYAQQGDSAIAKGNSSFALSEKFPKALDYNLRALKIAQEIGDKNGSAVDLGAIGYIYIRLNKLNEANKYLTDALKIADEIGNLEVIKDIKQNLSDLYNKKGDSKKAFEYYKQYIAVRDSINNEDKVKKQTRIEMNYEFDKKQAIAKAEQDKKDTQQRNIRNSIAAGLGGTLIFLVVVYRQRNKISKARKRSDELLLNILPEETAEELKATGSAEAKSFDEVTVMFTDFKNFTQASEKMNAKELVSEINLLFSEFDKIISKHNIEKIKTIGDSYMCAGGLPVANKTNATDVVDAALEIQHFMNQLKELREKENKHSFEIRIGIHTGSVVAGIVGIKKFAYDIWGDTVNIASRMESSGEAGKVNISGTTYELVKDKFICIQRGKIQAKNKGEIDMYFVERPI